jgi:hypothetical protein
MAWALLVISGCSPGSTVRAAHDGSGGQSGSGGAGSGGVNVLASGGAGGQSGSGGANVMGSGGAGPCRRPSGTGGSGGAGGAPTPAAYACPGPRASAARCSHFTSTHLGAFAGLVQEPYFRAALDWDGDGATDLLASVRFTASSTWTWVAMRGRCGTGLEDALLPTDLPSDLATSEPPAIGDFDGDGKVDLVFATLEDHIAMYPGLGDGTFGPALTTAVPHPFALAPADFDGDGRLDLAVAFVPGGYQAAVFLGRGSRGHFEMQSAVDLDSQYPGSMFAGDLDFDGISDVIAGTYVAPPAVFRANRQGHLTRLPSLSGVEHGNTLFVGAFNHDGTPDVFVCSAECILSFGCGDGTFVDGGRTARVVAVGDVDGDGFPDVVDWNGIQISQAGGLLTNVQPFTIQYLYGGSPFMIGDFAGDGRQQLLAANGDVWRMTCP